MVKKKKYLGTDYDVHFAYHDKKKKYHKSSVPLMAKSKTRVRVDFHKLYGKGAKITKIKKTKKVYALNGSGRLWI